MKIVVADNAGFCFGVKRAVDKAIECSKIHKNVVTLGPIIHNKNVVDELKKMGVGQIDSIDEADESSLVIIRSHGVSKQVLDTLEKRNIKYIDMTCPYVKKIQNIVKEECEKGNQVIIIGSREHPEVQGISGWCEKSLIFENVEELENWSKNEGKDREIPVSMVCQTTLNQKKWEICSLFTKNLYTKHNIFDTICVATCKRQKEAAELSSESQAVVVVGDKQSSNTKHLYQIASNFCDTVQYIERATELDCSILNGNINQIAILAGASTPDWAIKEVYDKMMDETKIITETEESFADILEATLKTLYTGDRVTGIVTGISPTEINVDLATKYAAYIPIAELSNEPNVDVNSIVKVGEPVEAFVMRVNDIEGTIMLSKKRLDAVKGWDVVEKARNDKEVVEGYVAEENKGGVIAVVSGVRVFIPVSQTGVAKDGSLESLLKTTVKLKITEVNRARRRVVGSIRAASFDERRVKADKVWETIEVGAKYKGIVKNLTSYGAFVDIGGVDGMVHVSELSWKHINNPSEVLKVGDELDVFVIAFDKEKHKISLGHKLAEDNPWTKFISTYTVGDVAEVKIVKFMPFGAFAEIMPGVDGLIHISQITSEKRVTKIAEVLTIGQMVNAKIVEIDMEKNKVSLSIKALEEKAVEATEDTAVEE